MEHLTQAAVNGNIFRIEYGRSVSILSGSSYNTRIIDSETLVLAYRNFQYDTGTGCLTDPVSPIMASQLCWSAICETVYTGSQINRASLFLLVEENDEDTVDYTATFRETVRYIMPLRRTGGSPRHITGERRVHSKYARVVFLNNTGQSVAVNFFIFGKVL